MRTLKALLELINNNTIVDICIKPKEITDTIRDNFRTVYYGSAIGAYEKRDELEEYWQRRIWKLYTYYDDGTNVPVMMIVLERRFDDEED